MKKKKSVYRYLLSSGKLQTILKKYSLFMGVDVPIEFISGDGLACTSGSVIKVNPLHPMILELKDDLQKIEFILGLIFHEIGHLLYTNFNVRNQQIKCFEENKMFLSETEYSLVMEDLYNDFKKYPRLDNYIFSIFMNIDNIIEDIIEETKLIKRYHGIVRKCIGFSRWYTTKDYEKIDEVLADLSEVIIIQNALIYELSTGLSDRCTKETEEGIRINNTLDEIEPFVQKALRSRNAREKYNHITDITLILYKNIIKPLLDKAEEQEKSSSSAEDSALDELKKGEDKKMETSSPTSLEENSELFEGEDDSEEDTPEKSSKRETEELETDDASAELCASDELSEMHKSIKSFDDKAEQEEESDVLEVEQELKTELSSGLVSLIKEGRTEETLENIDEEMTDFYEEITFSDMHTGLPWNFKRPVNHESYKSEYNTVKNELRPEINAFVRAMKRHFNQNEEMIGEMFDGQEIDVEHFYNPRGNIFLKRNAKTKIDLAFNLLIDVSGSMSECDRIKYAKILAVFLHEVSKELGIKHTINSHNISFYSHKMEYEKYFAFNSPESDAYRLMALKAKGDNRDGAALQFAIHELKHISAQKKVLIVMSDGSPWDVTSSCCSYHGISAEADMRGIIKKAEKQGITVIAAAIGSDKDCLKRIYGKNFLDVKNLKLLPKMFAKILEKLLLA